MPDLPSSEGGATHGRGGCAVPGMGVRDAWRQKENLGDALALAAADALAPLPRAPKQGGQATWQQDDMQGVSCGSLPKPPRPMSSKKGAEKRVHETELPKPVLGTGEATILLRKPIVSTARASPFSPTSGVVGGRGGRGAVERVVASEMHRTPSHEPLGRVGNQDSDVGGFFLTGLFVHDTPAKGEEDVEVDVEEGQQEHLSVSSKLCEKMQNIVLMRNMRASGSESESGDVEQGAAPGVCPLHTEMEKDDGVMQQEEAVMREEEAAQVMQQQEPAAPASSLREEHVLLAEQRTAEQDMEAKAAGEKAGGGETVAACCVAAANQAATEPAEQMLAAAECKAAGEVTGAPGIKASKAREQSPAQAKMEAEAKPAPGAASRNPEEDHAACAAAARHEEEETAQKRAETEAANRAATEAEQAHEKEDESSHDEALDRAKVQREVQESVEESARRACCMREELTTYLHQLEGKSARRPAAAGDEGLAGELEEDALIELPANFKEVVAAAEALAMHESERSHVRRACAAPTRPTRHAMIFSSASSSTLRPHRF